mmetsp:Transcript_63609/g.176933  ORF Transcript_63609/g.176933 Transcript_63609/m.176933 type:complete len:572 (-) Transcript_63609:133-1848(-)|eukprot:CAMPEP_0117460692 /NCGR_PEP_ID=MMETSP0784-20121206/2139_1 /TAXON_ID=39447 /ORGANISM="" /LENGTH=571 /DNA_ID=CAMNT_0005254373 /DNA_START=79 /DNA_END=1794 /DNA_ORIENTATION=-
MELAPSPNQPKREAQERRETPGDETAVDWAVALPQVPLHTRPSLLPAHVGRVSSGQKRVSNTAAPTASPGEEGDSAAQPIPKALPPSCRPTSRPLHAQSAEMNLRLKGITDASQNTPWHVVFPTDSLGHHACTVVNSIVHPFPRPLDVPPNAQAVIVIAMLKHQLACLEYIVELQDLIVVLPPIIVSILADEGETHADFLELAASFRRFGVRDIMVQRTTGVELRLDIAMCVRRAMAAADDVQKGIEAGIAEHDTKKFWACADKIVQGFPKQDLFCTVAPRPGVRVGDHDLLDKLGHGTFSEVFLSMNTRTNELEAFKAVSKTQIPSIMQFICLWNEISYLQRSKHPNVIQMKSVQHVRRHVFIVMEYAGRRNLHQFLKSLAGPNLAIAQDCIKQVLAGVAHCHEAGFAHRDLKPENIGIRDSDGDGAGALHLKILDFGCAIAASRACTDAIGTMPFIAPEMLLANRYIPAEADMWSCGVVLWELIHGIDSLNRMLGWTSAPQCTGTYLRQIARFFSARRSIKARLGYVDEYLVALVFGLLEVSARQRWTAPDAAQCIWLIGKTADQLMGC